MYALVDAVSFYASAEKVFDPSIRHKPVVVLTNNDGCICAVCPIAKTLNIPKFEPYFKLKKYLDQHNVVVRSSNYELYADLSARMMAVIGRFCSEQHVYSIDESFLLFSQKLGNWREYGELIRSTVWRETKLPVGVGFGMTPTLAKVANHAAKKLVGFNGVAVIDNLEQAEYILKQMKLADIWGIGSRLSKRLALLGLSNAWELAQQSAKKMRDFHSVVLEKTVRELNGEVCFSWDEVKQPKKEIFSTRSFGQRVTDKFNLNSALITHADIIGRKLRQQNSKVKRLLIFAHTSRFDPAYIKREYIHDFVTPTSDSLNIANAVSALVDQIYLPNIQFYKCGLGALELVNASFTQFDLFELSREKDLLMRSYDAINHKYGQGTLYISSAEQVSQWKMRRALLSPQYTTRWLDIPKIRCI
ncbi:Y-family DNA polymerase [Catenovulum maritimum]|uniref:XRE family transcriptional regulator n=1 Tax=Catenovulum maritimum TaxID=1513271 RepID=A0A0J8JLH0_9ALTE|nr:Y-family DNA polymerase [Catenovulum maritimum]KMT65411.1 XRE family transcriptional regulator [Catenovulum maritimum]